MLLLDERGNALWVVTPAVFDVDRCFVDVVNDWPVLEASDGSLDVVEMLCKLLRESLVSMTLSSALLESFASVSSLVTGGSIDMAAEDRACRCC